LDHKKGNADGGPAKKEEVASKKKKKSPSRQVTRKVLGRGVGGTLLSLRGGAWKKEKSERGMKRASSAADRDVKGK